jgi:hypothetical protein
MKNKKLLAEYMAMFGEVYDKEITKTLIKAYWACLAGFTDEQVEDAFKEAVTSLKFFPKPAELISIITRKSNSNTLDAWNAWGEVVGCLDSGEKPRDPKTLETVRRLGGWEHLQLCTYGELVWIEKKFKDNYNNIKEHNLNMLPEGNNLEKLNQITGTVGKPMEKENGN